MVNRYDEDNYLRNQTVEGNQEGADLRLINATYLVPSNRGGA